MKSQIVKHSFSAVIGFLLTAPTAYFILISLLKYVVGWPALFNSAQPILEHLGIKNAMGWNINLLIFLGPLIALLLNLVHVLYINWQADESHIELHLFFQKELISWLIIALSSLCLFILFMYALGENCNC